MNVILKEDLENLGFEYEIVNVKPGYARNYLIPQGKAILATPKAVEELNEIMEARKEEEKAAIAKAKEIIASLEGLEIVITAKAGEGEKLFGSINNSDLKDLLNKKGVNVERKHVQIMGKSIKRLGKYNAIIKPHREVEYELSFDVVPED